MNKVLLLNGSPRGKGSSTLKLADAFLEGYAEGREVEVERIDLAELDIGPCRGCFGCWKSGAGSCVQRDDMDELLPASNEADLVLVSTPVYHFGMTAILKAFFERTLPLNYPYMVKVGEIYTHPARAAINPRRRFGLVSTCGFPDADNFRAMKAHFEKLLGPSLAFSLFCPEGELLGVPQLRELAATRLAATRRAGASFARSGSVAAEDAALLAEPIVGVEAFARMANASWGVPGEEPPTEAALRGLEPYSPKASGSSAPDAAAVKDAGPSPARALLAGMAGLFNPKAAEGLEAVLRFDFTDLGESYELDLSGETCSLRPGSERKPTTRIIVPFSTWERISRGELKGEEALMKGAYRVEGDFGLMMRMGSLFSPSSDASSPKAKRRPNLMALSFIPWYFGWFLGGRSPWLGQLLPLGLSLAFLAWREARREATWFERATPIAFAFLSCVALASPSIMASFYSALCNAAIALVWGMSLALGRPLTSDYSKSDYAETVASGLIFRRINLILTALWTALFALSALSGLAFAFFGASQGRAALFNALALIPAGAFTAWFPRWYPAHLAKRGTGKAAEA